MVWRPIKQYRDSYLWLDENRGSPELFDKWAAGKNISRYSTAVSGLDWERVLYTGRLTYKEPDRDDPPELDHPVLFKGSGRVWLVYQPYIAPERIQEPVTAWAEERGLHAEIYDMEASWYYPGNTCLVVISKGELQND